MKTGALHLESLNDGRRWILDGATVPDVTAHPAFRNFTATAAGFFDAIAAPDNQAVMSFESPSSGTRVGRHWQLPATRDELLGIRAHMQAMAALSCGMVGRSPDHVAAALVGMVMGIEVFERHDPRGASALLEYFRHARDNDLYLSYVIVNPQADRSKSAAGQAGGDLVARIVDEDAQGITIRGAKMLATSAVAANEILISGIQPLMPGDEDYAFTAALPVATPGLSLMSRRSYEAMATSEFDNPLSYRFDENDAVAHFDNVRIPHDRVFLKRNLAAAAAQWHDTRAHVYQNYQSLVRLTVKLRFLLGMAHRIAEVNGTLGLPQVRDTLGALAAKVSLMDAALAGMEAAGEPYQGCFVPNRSMLCAGQAAAQRLYPEMMHTLRELAGGGLIMLPSSAQDLMHLASRSLVERTQHSPAASPLERVKFFKLVWDAVGSEFGSRHLQYEMFYSGAPFVINAHNYRFYDWQGAVGMVSDFMGSYGTPPVTAPATTPAGG